MDYQKIYNDLIESAKSKNRKKSKEQYYEKHHILPRCMNGDNSKDNLVLLTAREHFVAHKLLHYIYPSNSSIFFAYFVMSTFKKGVYVNRNYSISSREYERLKIIHKHFLSENMKGEKCFFYGKKGELSPNWNREYSQEYKDMISIQRKEYFSIEENRVRNGEFTRQNFQNEKTRNKHKKSQQKRWEDEEEHNKLSKSLKKHYENPEAIEKNRRTQKEYWKDKPKPNEGREFSEEWIENIGKGQKKRFENPEERKKISDFVRSQPPLVCPHCGKIGRSCVMYRHHFDNCKHKSQEVAA